MEIEALTYFGNHFPRCEIISVPHLHAKVYAADGERAIVTSANLTSSALDRNVEYGIQIDSAPVVTKITLDLLGHAKLGSPVTLEALKELGELSQDLITQYQRMESSVGTKLRRAFNNKLSEVTYRFLATQVGPRSAQSVFSEAILFALRKGPLSTRELHPQIQGLLPELCDDSIELIINGERFGKRWKHQVRNAQQGLKNQGAITFNGRRWALTPAGRRIS